MSTAAAFGIVVGGGGSPSTDCLAVLDAGVNAPPTNPRNVVCVDGAACDKDGLINGSCEIEVTVCVNSTDPSVSGCTLNGVESITVDHAKDNGDPRFDPDMQALQNKIDGIDPSMAGSDACDSPTHLHVPIKGPFRNHSCRHNKKRLKVTTVSQPVVALGGRVFTDTDKMILTCEPAPHDEQKDEHGCDPQKLYLGGTFDRIQTQIFNQSCAVSSCHDSTSHQKDLLLETGSSYGNLVNVDPQTAPAFAAGWKRVTPGDSSTSFLYHKVTGDLPDDTYGLRMPRMRRKLNSTLIDVIRLWIDAGAPMEGVWVPGTD